MTGVSTCFADQEHRKEGEGEALRQAFTAALVLTGSVEQAQTAVLESIACLDLDRTSIPGALFEGTLQRVIARGPESVEQQPGEFDEALSLLPTELRRVLRLPAYLRRCFTLRVLARLPSRICAALLDREIREIERATAEAVQALASVSRAGCLRYHAQLTSG